ncbi:MAG: sorbosone dehydrogenase family protein, partial [Geminicoccaceae bacterium]
VDLVQAPRSATTDARARLNFLYHAGDYSGRLFTCDSRGLLYAIEPGTRRMRVALDLWQVRGDAFFGSFALMGLRGFAFHPDCARPGRPGFRRLYTSHTERPRGTAGFSGPYRPHHHDVVSEWLLDPADPGRVLPRSRRELLRIAQWGRQHNTDQLMFDPHLQPGMPGYGLMLVGVGDGGNNPPHPDPYDQAQNPGLIPGKVLRIDPLPQPGGAPYGIPPDNPFVGIPGAHPEIFALGLRHPQNFSYDIALGGALILADIGQHEIEEINLLLPGRNYGWPLREGTFVTDRLRQEDLYALPADDASRGLTYPVAQYDHDEGDAITGGFVYHGSAVPALQGHYLFGDLVNGRVFHLPASELALGRQAAFGELTLLRRGVPTTMLELMPGKQRRVDLRFGQDQAGEVYITSKRDGWIRRLQGVPCGSFRCDVDGLRYIASYPDLILAFGPDAAAGQRHFTATGQFEGRNPCGFDVLRYLARYPDLQAAFGSDVQAATVHYISYGYREGRSAA